MQIQIDKTVVYTLKYVRGIIHGVYLSVNTKYKFIDNNLVTP